MPEIFESVEALNTTTLADEYNEITREMIEGCLDDELNEQYDPWVPNENAPNTQVDASECFKKLKPELYEEFFIDYCVRGHIRIINFLTSGKTIYLEPKEV